MSQSEEKGLPFLTGHILSSLQQGCRVPINQPHRVEDCQGLATTLNSYRKHNYYYDIRQVLFVVKKGLTADKLRVLKSDYYLKTGNP